ncbi:Ribonuclease HII [uncultured archaeon]|nr:Ribonuclease HII [uncultured archaeon]
MQETLNFGKGHKEKILEALSKFEQGEVTSYFEEQRAKKDGCTITLYNSGKVSIQGKDAAKVKDELLAMLGLHPELTIGIDETGRGEREGPMVICGVLADTNGMRQLRDSKKTGDIAAKEKIVSEKMLASVSVTINSGAIDLLRSRGSSLNEIEAMAMAKISEFLSGLDANAKIIADGAPIKMPGPAGNAASQKINFLPKGDDLEPVVGAASVVAKHLRNSSHDMGERKTWNRKVETNEQD